MSDNDILKDWFQEGEKRQTSDNFSREVMKQVMIEWQKNPTEFKPIINKKVWWFLGALLLAFFMFLSSLDLPANSGMDNLQQAWMQTINLQGLLNTFGAVFEKLNNISPAVGVGVLAIIALWFFDQFFTKMAQR